MRPPWRVLRDEGVAAVRDRIWDHLAEAARRRSYASMPPGWRPEDPIPVLLVCPAPPADWLRTRLEAESLGRSTALLSPHGGVWRLEVRSGAERRFLELPGSAFEEAVRWAVERVGARAVHAEGLAHLPAASLLRLAREGLMVLLSLHDFDDLQEPPRELAAELLAAAAAVVFPSDFLRRSHAELFPGLTPERWHVLEPPIASTVALPRPLPDPLRHVALAGSIQPVFAETVRRLEGTGLRWSAYGGGGTEHLRALRRLGVRVRGYYRSGSLPGLLRREGVDLVLLLPLRPEPHSTVLGECVVAGVPVVAYAAGVLAERVPRLAAGRLVSPEQGVEGVVAALREIQRDGLPVVPEEAARLLADPVSAAAGHLALYRELGLDD